MNFDRFKNIKLNTVTPKDYDSDYVKTLNTLPQKPQSKSVLPILGTVAAALVMVIGVSLWAIIGRGVRGTEPKDALGDFPTVTAPAAQGDSTTAEFNNRETEMSPYVDSTKEYELNEENIKAFKKMLEDHYDIVNIPIFTETEPLKPDDAVNYAKRMNAPNLYTQEGLNKFTYKMFNVKDMFAEDYITDGFHQIVYNKLDFVTIAEHTLTSGHRVFVVVYTVDDSEMRTLEYVAGDGIEVDWFKLHILNNSDI